MSVKLEGDRILGHKTLVTKIDFETGHANLFFFKQHVIVLFF